MGDDAILQQEGIQDRHMCRYDNRLWNAEAKEWEVEIVTEHKYIEERWMY